MSSLEIKELWGPVFLGEGPFYEAGIDALMYVDAFKGDFHRHFVATGQHQVLHIENCDTGGSVTVIIPIQDLPEHYVITTGRSFAVVRWPKDSPDHLTLKPTILHTFDDHLPTNFFNDGKCDPQGRFWAGTRAPEFPSGELDEEKGTMYRMDSEFNVTQWFDKLTVSNGMAWSHDNKTMFYIDSQAFSVDAFDYDDQVGSVVNRRKILDYKKVGLESDIPDGMTIDVDGNLWVANYFGDKIICIDPKEGKIVRTVVMPVTSPTSMCWGGDDLATLFVTSSRASVSEEQLKEKPRGGATFAITGLGTRGVPPMHFKANLELLNKKLQEK